MQKMGTDIYPMNLLIDEFADLIMTAGKEVEHPMARIAQLARADWDTFGVATQKTICKCNNRNDQG